MSRATMQRRGVAAAHRLNELLPAENSPAAGARPHVCFVALHAWPVLSGDPRIAEVGGAEVQQSILARLFAARGYPVSMICHDYGQPGRSVIDKVTVHKAFAYDAGLPVLRFVYPRVTLMWRALLEADADIYYCRAASVWVGLVAHFCRRHGKRSIYAAASDMDFTAGEGGQIPYARDRWMFRWGVGRIDRIVAQNQAQRSSCRARYGREAVVIPSCYEPPAHARSARAPRDTVLWVGTIRAGKRPELFLQLATRLPQRRFVMVGGPDRAERALFERVRHEAQRLSNVEFTGFLPLAQVETRFDTARVLVNTSEFEGMPNIFLQAWARGVPTVATVEAAATAHRRFHELDQGAREIESFFADAKRWENASRGCREYFERSHSGAETLERYSRLFDELAG
jgi:glycosyltransferase involved in cell wall biosynthesis